MMADEPSFVRRSTEQAAVRREAAAFDSFAEESGERRFVPEAGSSLEFLLGWLRELAAPLVAAGRWRGQPMRLEIGWIDSLDYNAWAATTDDGIDLIGLNVGLVTLLDRTFAALLSHPGFYPTVGANADHPRGPFRFAPEVERLPVDAAAWPPAEMADPDRLKLHNWFVTGALSYVVGHELSHIKNGHTEWSPGGLRIRRLDEAQPGSREGFRGLASQTLEWDADLDSAQHIMASFSAAQIEQTDGSARWTLPPYNGWGNIEQAIGAAAIVISITHLYFSSADEALHPDAKDREHPPSTIRIFQNLQQLVHTLWYRAGFDRERAGSAAMAGLNELTATILEMCPGMKPHPEQAPALEALMSELFDAYTKEWALLRPQLEPMVRRGTLAPAEPPSDPL